MLHVSRFPGRHYHRHHAPTREHGGQRVAGFVEKDYEDLQRVECRGQPENPRDYRNDQKQAQPAQVESAVACCRGVCGHVSVPRNAARCCGLALHTVVAHLPGVKGVIGCRWWRRPCCFSLMQRMNLMISMRLWLLVLVVALGSVGCSAARVGPTPTGYFFWMETFHPSPKGSI